MIEPDHNRTLDLHQLHQALLSMLERFDGFCRAHGLAYSMLAGTLLGAVRHQGFIPWDDDADVCMPRPDVERLVGMADTFHRETGMRLMGYMDVPLEHAALIKVADERVVVQPHNEPDLQYLALDLSPIDGLPESDEALGALYGKTHRLLFGLSVLATLPAAGRTPSRRAIRYLAAPVRKSQLARIAISRQLVKLAKSTPYGSTEYVGSVSWGHGWERERVHLATFEHPVTMPFERLELQAMGCWEEYLSHIYGPYYMQVPPPEERVTHFEGAWMAKGASPLS